MSKYCPACDQITNCTENCKDCLNNTYKLTLAIYPIADCGEDLSKGEPLEVSYEGTDINKVKDNLWDTVFRTMKAFNASDGLTYIEYDIEKNGEYFDSDDGYFRIDLTNDTAKFLID